MRYELKHDKLAAQVYELASSEAKARRKAEGIYLMYEEIGRNRLFTEEELEYLVQFQSVLQPKENLRVLKQKSKDALGLAKQIAEEKERALWEREKELIERAKLRQKRIWWVIAGAAIVAGIVLYIAFDYYKEAEKQRELANNLKLSTEEIRRNLLDKNQLNEVLKSELAYSLKEWASFDRRATLESVEDLNEILPSAFIDIRDWNIYETVELNGQTWMAANLNYKIDGESWFVEADSLNPLKYGRLYSWGAAQKACPEGWRLPSDEEWQAMITLYGGDIDAYPALMEGGNTNFLAVLGGRRGPSGRFDEQNMNAYYWSSSELEGDAARFISFLGEFAIISSSSNSQSWGYSCRCIAEE